MSTAAIQNDFGADRTRGLQWSTGRAGAHWLAWLTLAATLVLICSGGLVTSKGVGMAVPDWPTTYGYNMFLFPVSKWVGGIFYEHTHRLLASGVGFLTMILAAWLLAVEPRRWVRVLVVLAFVAVVVQGVIGGLRVTLYADWIGIFHGVLAQAFLAALAVLVYATRRRFVTASTEQVAQPGSLRWALAALTCALFLQLGLGAAMRHAHAGLAIPDFPLAYGQLWPATAPQTISEINAQRRADNRMPTTATQIHLQMVHRLLAVAILAGVVAFAWKAWRGSDAFLRRVAGIWLVLIAVQFGLGAWTVWSDKAADVATAHVAVGALCLLTGVLASFRQFYFHRANFLAAGAVGGRVGAPVLASASA